MTQQRRTRLVMGPCIVEIDRIIDRIVIREVQYQLEVNQCRNEGVIVKGNFGWVWPMWARRPRVGNGAMHFQYQLEVNRPSGCGLCGRGVPGLVMGPCIVDIDRIVIREVQYQFQVNWCRNEEIIVKDNFGWVWSMWAGRPRIDRIVKREVHYQFEACRNEEMIVKGPFGWVWSMWVGRPRIECIVIREVQYQFELKRCKKNEIIIKGNFGWVWSMWARRPRIDRIVIREVQYQFEVNRCRHEEIIVKCNFGWAWRPRVGNGAMHTVFLRL
ncbi:hypothetical protein DPMN_013167 [Dreissena polymorpha]|uniref:Uncharacterized protein n=1 Tax=Dreissena polymorpha TaxID=45954 RepID=A0A9D4N758_DREPO|nr:hypothetical protein DPMN_013167 [Dreissena polymorpha]